MKIIKFDLQLEGVIITNLDELQDNFSADILPIFQSGRLAKWFQSRDLLEQAAATEAIAKDGSELQQLKAICQVLGLDDDEEVLQFLLEDRQVAATAAMIASPAAVVNDAASNDGTLPQSSGVDWSGQDLSERRFVGENLRHANLTGTNFSGADLSNADLSGANLDKANLSGAKLTGANLSNANLSESDLAGANLVDADLTAANLSSAILNQANLTQANLRAAQLIKAKLLGADLTNADLSDANLSGAEFSFLSMSPTPKQLKDFRPADRNFLSSTVGKGASWFAGCVPSHTAGVNAFASVLLNACAVMEATPGLSTATHISASLVNANLMNADLTGANLSGVKLDGANLSDANLTQTALYKAQANGVNFSNANLTEARLERASAVGANFTKANLSRASCIRMSLYDANFSQTDLSFANLTGAIFASPEKGKVGGKCNLLDTKLTGVIGFVAPTSEDTYPDGAEEWTWDEENAKSSREEKWAL